MVTSSFESTQRASSPCTLGIRKDGSATQMNKWIDYMARHTGGFSGADLDALVKEASIRAIRRLVQDHPEGFVHGDDGPLAETVLRDLLVTSEDLQEARLWIKPSGQRGPRLSEAS